MRALAIGAALAAVLFLTTGGHLILIPLVLAPLSLLSLPRVRDGIARLRAQMHTIKPPNVNHQAG